jgi:hypothetical protein
MKRILFLSVLFLSILLSACGTAKATTTDTPAAPVLTSTPDLCTSANLPVEAAKVHKLTREFDDYAALASNTPQAQLLQVIPDMQRVLRDAEDQPVPACLVNLKKLQLADMNTVVQTLMGFMNTSAKDPAGVNQVNAGIAQARNLHGQYDVELARLLGITLVAPATTTPGAATTPEVVATHSAPAATITNLGAAAVNLRAAPDVNAPSVAILGSQISTTALGKTADDQWIQVQVPDKPGQTAWVFAQLVQLSVPISSLPVVTP